LFGPQCRNSAEQQRLGHCADGQYPQKTQRQAWTRNQKTDSGRTQGSESAAAHERLHGAAAREFPRVIAVCRVAGACVSARRIEGAPQFLP
jgi:hypothetical protein